jgi:hypothetical protein
VSEWLAAALVGVGVTLMIWGHDWNDYGYGFPLFFLGSALLCFGVRLAIDAAKARRR